MITNTELEYKGNLYPNHIIKYKRDTDKFYFTSENGVILEITVLRNSAIRFRYATEEVFQPDFSYAISPDGSRGYNKLEATETKTVRQTFNSRQAASKLLSPALYLVLYKSYL